MNKRVCYGEGVMFDFLILFISTDGDWGGKKSEEEQFLRVKL